MRELAIKDAIIENIRMHNPFLRSVRQALANNEAIPVFRLILSDKPPSNAATRTYNHPTVTQISAIVTGDG